MSGICFYSCTCNKLFASWTTNIALIDLILDAVQMEDMLVSAVKLRNKFAIINLEIFATKAAFVCFHVNRIILGIPAYVIGERSHWTIDCTLLSVVITLLPTMWSD